MNFLMNLMIVCRKMKRLKQNLNFRHFQTLITLKLLDTPQSKNQISLNILAFDKN
jgi:hypothetical protein